MGHRVVVNEARVLPYIGSVQTHSYSLPRTDVKSWMLVQ